MFGGSPTYSESLRITSPTTKKVTPVCRRHKNVSSLLWILSTKQEKVKMHTYRKMFDTEFNVAINKQISDRCDWCKAYENVFFFKWQNGNNYSKLQNCMTKQRNWQNIQANNKFYVACFDLEQVLHRLIILLVYIANVDLRITLDLWIEYRDISRC